ncbi:MAG: hypothetical protein WBD59_06665 [Candidatus Sulfotelmatobacter sp.]
MPFLERIVGANFRTEEGGRIVVFPGDRRDRGHVVRSEAEELKIRAFLKMFYFAYFAIFFLGGVLSTRLSVDVYNASLDSYAHLLRALCICVGIYLVVLGLPFLLLWSSYKKSALGFVSAQNEVVLSDEALALRRKARQRLMIALTAGVVVLAACLGGVAFLARAR